MGKLSVTERWRFLVHEFKSKKKSSNKAVERLNLITAIIELITNVIIIITTIIAVMNK